MEATILDIETLPSFFQNQFSSATVAVRKHGQGFILLPADSVETPLWGLLEDAKLSTETFLAQKRLDKELEA